MSQSKIIFWANVRRKLQNMFMRNINNKHGIDFIVEAELNHTLPW